MFRYNVATVVLALPFVVASLLAVRSKRIESRQEATLAWFDRCLVNGNALPVHRLERDFSASAVQEHLQRAAESPLVAFDGSRRIAQIEPKMLTFGDRSLDGLTLYTLLDDSGPMTHQLPIGTRIDSIALVDDGLLVTLHGELTIRGTQISIPEGKPETYRIRWPNDAPPPPATLASSILSRKRD